MNEPGDGPPTNISALTPVIQAVLEKGESPAQAAAEIVSEVRTVITRHRGPLPDPETLAAYNQLIPNGAERCMGLVEREAAHRHKQEDLYVRTNMAIDVRGQWIGLALVILLGAAGVALGWNGHDWLAGTIFTTTIIGVITVFVLGRRNAASSDKDDEDGDDEKSRNGAEEPAISSQDRAKQVALKKRRNRR